MSFMQLAVNRVIRKHTEMQEHVNDALTQIDKHENTDEAFDAYCSLIDAGIISYSEYTSSDPFDDRAPGVSIDSPYDYLYMERGSTRDWGSIYDTLCDRGTEDSLLQDWKRAIIKSRTTHFRYDW